MGGRQTEITHERITTIKTFLFYMFASPNAFHLNRSFKSVLTCTRAARVGTRISMLRDIKEPLITAALFASNDFGEAASLSAVSSQLDLFSGGSRFFTIIKLRVHSSLLLQESPQKGAWFEQGRGKRDPYRFFSK